jgi:hypothetical protein
MGTGNGFHPDLDPNVGSLFHWTIIRPELPHEDAANAVESDGVV